MSATIAYDPRDIIARIAYWPEGIAGSAAAEENASNIANRIRAVDIREMTIHDSRSVGGDFTLDENGFQILLLPRAPKYTKDDREIEAEQYPELIDAIKNITGASHVRIFSHIIRDTYDPRPFSERLHDRIHGDNSSSSTSSTSRAPAIRPHVDFHAGTCPSFFSNGHPLLTQYIASGARWQVLGIWRPLKTIQRNPLALCDARTVDDEVQFEKVEREFRGRPGAYCVLKAGGGGGGGDVESVHRWCYLPEQRPDEAWVMKHFDSLRGERVARQCAHTSFEVPGTRNLPPRESIEFRALVFY